MEDALQKPEPSTIADRNSSLCDDRLNRRRGFALADVLRTAGDAQKNERRSH